MADVESILTVLEELARKVPHDRLYVVLACGQTQAVTFLERTGDSEFQSTLERLILSGSLPLGVVLFHWDRGALQGERMLSPWLKQNLAALSLFQEICEEAEKSIAAEARTWERLQ